MNSDTNAFFVRKGVSTGIRSSEHWSKFLSNTIKTNNHFTFQLINSNEEWSLYKSLLMSWADLALSQISKDGRETLHSDRERIGNIGTVCTPPDWNFHCEQACVCLDLFDSAMEFSLESHEETHYQICSPEGVTIGVIALEEGCRYEISNKLNVAFSITGLVKSPVFNMSLQNEVKDFLSKVIGASEYFVGKSKIAVASARGAVRAYQGYNFVSEGVDANHFGLNPCGCTVMTRNR